MRSASDARSVSHSDERDDADAPPSRRGLGSMRPSDRNRDRRRGPDHIVKTLTADRGCGSIRQAARCLDPSGEDVVCVLRSVRSIAPAVLLFALDSVLVGGFTGRRSFTKRRARRDIEEATMVRRSRVQRFFDLSVLLRRIPPGHSPRAPSPASSGTPPGPFFPALRLRRPVRR
jgi:hypothetical protein